VGNSESELELVSDAKALTAKVQSLTDEMAGTKGQIIDQPIFLHITSAHAPDLTLVDLPGIAKNPLVDSEQSDDIEDITKSLISKFIDSPETVILAVVPANMDAADALKVARKHDPKMERTIGVVTKLDLMDEGTSASKLLQGKDVSFKLGVVGVRNRSQGELNSGMTLQKALDREESWLTTHEVYSKMPKELLGTKSLSSKLMTVLGTQIQKRLPVLKSLVLARIDELEEELGRMGDGPASSERERRRDMLKLLEKFSQAVNNTISGRSIDHLTDTIHSSVLLGSAFIRKVFSDFAAEIESEVHHIGERYRDETILKLIRASPGYNLPGFDSFDAFSHLVLKHHKKLKEPCLSMVDVVIDHIREEIIPNSLSRIMAFDTYPDLKEAVKEAAMDLVADTAQRRGAVLTTTSQLWSTFTRATKSMSRS